MYMNRFDGKWKSNRTLPGDAKFHCDEHNNVVDENTSGDISHENIFNRF